MWTRRAVSLCFLAVFAGLHAAACNKSGGGQQGNSGAGGVKVGAVIPLSGPTATYGEEALNGLKMAVDELNGKSKTKIDLVFKDNKGDSTETAKLVGQLIKVDGAKAIIGAVASTNSLKGAKVAQESGVPMLTPASTNVAVTKKGDFISRICFIDPVQGNALARLALGDLGKKKAALIVDKASDYSVGLADAFKKTFTAGGGTIVGDESFTAGEADFSAIITKVTSLEPDVIFIPAYYGDVGPMLKQAGNQWKDIPVVAGDGIDSPDFAKLMGGYRGPIYMSSHFAPDDTNPQVQAFVKAYKAKYGKTPGAMGALGYDAGLVLHAALEKSGGTDPKKIRDAINGTKGLPGVTGKISLDESRNAQKDVVILKVSSTGSKFFKRVSG